MMKLKPNLPIVISSDLRNQTILEGILMKKVENPIVSFPYDRTPMAGLPKEQTINFGGVLTQTSKGLNFLQKELKKYVSTENTFNKLPFYITLAAGVALFILSYSIDFYSKAKAIDLLKAKNKNVYTRYFKKTATSDTNILEEAKKQVAVLKRKTEIFNIFFRDKSFSEVIVNFNQLFPPGEFTEIDNVTYTPKKISFAGKALTSSLISDLKTGAEGSSVFDSINCNQRTTPSRGGGKQWKFRCTLNLKRTKGTK